jgi:hypothetical protein
MVRLAFTCTVKLSGPTYRFEIERYIDKTTGKEAEDISCFYSELTDVIKLESWNEVLLLIYKKKLN